MLSLVKETILLGLGLWCVIKQDSDITFINIINVRSNYN